MSSLVPFAPRGSFQQSSPAVKDIDMSSLERDAGFCSGGDDEELDDIHSPTDASEDSVEVKVEPICLRNKNKRKCAEPRKVASEEKALPPYKKRRHFIQESSKLLPDERYHVRQASKKSPALVQEELTSIVHPRSSVSPFRPWSHATPCERRSPVQQVGLPNNPPKYTERVPELPNQEEPLSLVVTPPEASTPTERKVDKVIRRIEQQAHYEPPRTLLIKSEFPVDQPTVLDTTRRLELTGYDQRRFLVSNGMDGAADSAKRFEPPRTKDERRLQLCGVEMKREPGCHPYTVTRPSGEDTAVDFTITAGPSHLADSHHEGPRGRRTLSEMANEDRVVCGVEDLSGRVSQSKFNVETLLLNGKDVDDRPGTSSTPSTSSDKKNSPSGSNQQQRNYKNMTRERRVEANARERTRVHTISAAFDTLRRTIPAYSHNQKLSKLSVLRIACSYILTLSRVAGSDYSADNSEPSLADCVDYVSRTIQTEGKLRKKKDE